MKKLLLPALVIAAVGGYLYYINLDAPAPQAVTAEEAIVEDVNTAVAEAEAAGTDVKPAGEKVMAAADGDVFADVPEAMDHVLDEASEVVEEAVETAEESAEETAEGIDHAHE